MNDVRNVSDHSKGTDRESEGAFTPTKSPCNRILRGPPQSGDVGALDPGNRFRMTGNRQGGDLNRYIIIPSLTVGVQLFKSRSTDYVICS